MYKVDNAIILAAGRGRRLGKFTEKTPKPLLKIDNKNKSMIEKIVENLIKKNINEIIVVTGYLAEQFEFMKDKYKVQLIYNPNWETSNNISSLKSARPFLKNSLIVNGDIVMKKNVFQNYYPKALTYVEKNKNLKEWIVELDKNENIKSFDKNGEGKNGFYQREITFLSLPLAKEVLKQIDNFDDQEYQEFLLLEVSKKNNIPFGILEVKPYSVFDLDYQQDYEDYLISNL